MTGICGWFGSVHVPAVPLLDAMRRRITWNGAPGECSIVGNNFGLAAVGPADAIGAFELGDLRIAFHGHGFWRERDDAGMSPREVCVRLADAYHRLGPEALSFVGGDFALALIDTSKQHALLAVDRMGVRNVVYRHEQDVLTFAATLDALAAYPHASHRVSPQALYDYVYFHMVPGPSTVFEGSLRLLPGHYLLARPGAASTRAYWTMQFEEEKADDPRAYAEEFRATLRSSVRGYMLRDECGTFLSGGTDSSTVTGVLAAMAPAPVGTYSIGFDAAGYDEMQYARIAAAHFKTEHHEYYVTPQDVVSALPVLASEYDQPFGNASAVPTYYCAKLAQSAGIRRMLAGDGGDELFGGNARYARQHQLSLYEAVPSLLRSLVIEPLLGVPGMQGIPLARKGRSYVEQARLPMPQRYETYNLLERLGPESVFDADFLATVDTREPIARLSSAYEATNARSLVNRMMALDLRFTLADNDLPKVTRMCDQAGVDVAFPLLHDSVVDFSAGLPPRLKLRGTQLRYFFKEALRGFLPDEILRKQKHGFGLPAGPWLVSHAPLHALARDALASLGRRGIFRRPFLDELIERQLHQHPGYYGTMVWILMMLELWFVEHVDKHPRRAD
jgi:asparagine synthase (glutamine-hydrolysing)